MPIATSRSASFSPNTPMPIPLTKVKPTSPASGDRPNSTAPVAPVKPTCESAWPAKVWPRSTRKNPTVPARIAARPDAAKAVRMKSYSSMGVVAIVRMAVPVVIVAVRVALDVDVPGHDEIAILDVDDLDIRPIEARQHRSSDDLFDGADHRCSPAEIEHPVDGVDQGIELVSAEQDRDLEVVADASGDFDHVLLMRRIERDQRPVEHHEARLADEGLAQQHELALAAGQFADRAAGEVAGPHFVERPVDLAPRRPVETDETEPAADRCRGDDVPAPDPEARHRQAGLRHVADKGVAARRRATEHRDGPRSDGNEAERSAHQRRLAGPVRAQHADKFAVLDVET